MRKLIKRRIAQAKRAYQVAVHAVVHHALAMYNAENSRRKGKS